MHARANDATSWSVLVRSVTQSVKLMWTSSGSRSNRSGSEVGRDGNRGLDHRRDERTRKSSTAPCPVHVKAGELRRVGLQPGSQNCKTDHPAGFEDPEGSSAAGNELTPGVDLLDPVLGRSLKPPVRF